MMQERATNVQLFLKKQILWNNDEHNLIIVKITQEFAPKETTKQLVYPELNALPSQICMASKLYEVYDPITDFQ